MTREKAIEKILLDLHFPQDWRWYVNDVLDRQAPGCETLDLETVQTLEQFINIDLKGGKVR